MSFVPSSSTGQTLGRVLATLFWTGLAAAAGALIAGIGNAAALSVVVLTLFVAATATSFAVRYMRADRRQLAFYASVGALVASVIGFVLAPGLIGFAIAWLASGQLLASLIGHDRNWTEARAAARRARFSFAIGDLALIGGFAILAGWAKSTAIADIATAAPTMPIWAASLAALLLLIAAAARCALPPFSGWLLSSMTAPTPVSALMHAGLVNAGGVLLIRFAPVIEAAPAARIVGIAVGLVAALYGIAIMAVRPDVKRALAGSTVSQMGFMVMSCALGAYGAALWHLIAHGLFKAWLFLGSGSAIGMRDDAPPSALGKSEVMIGGAATLAIGTALAISGTASAAYVPMLLAAATAIATLAASIGARLPSTSRAALIALIAALALVQAAGLTLAHAAAGADGAAILPGWTMIVLTAGFVALWLWQQRALALRLPLPAPLYVRLLNAGALPRFAGDAK